MAPDEIEILADRMTAALRRTPAPALESIALGDRWREKDNPAPQWLLIHGELCFGPVAGWFEAVNPTTATYPA